MPKFSPVDITVSRSSEDPSTITVTWRPYNLVEARGFIEYIVQLHLEESKKRQALEEQRVPMNKSSAEFSGLDTASNYEVSVGTMSLSGDASGPGAAIHNIITLVDKNVVVGGRDREGGARVKSLERQRGRGC